MDRTYDVVIVGGGVTGSSTAYWLASRDGFSGSVLVAERDPTYEGAQIVFKDTAALARDFPWLRHEELAGGYFGERNEGWVDPYGLLMAFRGKVRSPVRAA